MAFFTISSAPPAEPFNAHRLAEAAYLSFSMRKPLAALRTVLSDRRLLGASRSSLQKFGLRAATTRFTECR